MNGRWAVPGTTYGEEIVALYEKMADTMDVKELIDRLGKKIIRLETENARLRKELTEYKNTIEEIKEALSKLL
ncbi:hypothetical protein [Halobacillus yeomjeoni]|uniref:Uncharacterized protein n=1 Tax=Halobacillus yeomjeoni TaxID=311194 RepID=A0A931HW01_9BACI|nr:hypothetical protein [Halobacillus yeomjeoni]MBH0230513.1 hypothetical protein [Halobacillus yeomjeoni]